MLSKNLKALIVEVISFSGELDAEGKKQPRTTYPKKYYSALMGLKKRIIDTMEVAVVNTDVLEKLKATGVTGVPTEMVSWVKLADKKDNQSVVAERQTDEDVEPTGNQIAGFKYLYDALDELPILDSDVIEEVEKLIA